MKPRYRYYELYDLWILAPQAFRLEWRWLYSEVLRPAK